MKKTTVIGSIVALLLASALPAVAADRHDHAAATPAGLELDNGKKWKTDAPLREGMSDIQKRAQKMPADAAAATALATAIRGDVNGIVKNCKLSPKADAALHVILHDMLAGVNELERGKTAAAREQSLHRLHEALATYPRYFEHPDWPEGR